MHPLRLLYGNIGDCALSDEAPSPSRPKPKPAPKPKMDKCPSCETGTLRCAPDDCVWTCNTCTYNDRACIQCGCTDIAADHASYVCMQCGRSYDGDLDVTFGMREHMASFQVKRATAPDQPLEFKHQHLTSIGGVGFRPARLAKEMDSAAQRRDNLHESYIVKYCNLLDARPKLRAKAIAVSEMLAEEARRQKRRFNCPDVTAAAIILACAGACDVHFSPSHVARVCEVRQSALHNKYKAVTKFMRNCKPISRELEEKSRAELLRDKIAHIARVADVPLYIADYACDVVCKLESVRTSSSRLSTLALVALRRAIDTIPFKYVPTGEKQFKMSTKDLIAKCGESVVPSTVSNLNKQLFSSPRSDKVRV
jgi:hypothetical protein